MFQKLILIALVSIFILIPAPLKAKAELNYYRYYFKEMQPLELDLTRVVILERAEKLDKGRFEKFSIADEDIKPRVRKGWSEAKTPANVKTAAGVEELVADMSRENAADFISPVFLGKAGGQVVFTEEIFVGFQEGVDTDRAELILGEANVGTILDRDYANMAGVYRLRSRSRNGFEVLETANSLAEQPEVKFAEPDGIFGGRGVFSPNDPCFPECWGIHNTGQSGGTLDIDMDGPEAWDVNTGDPCVIVVIFDCGVDQSHPDIYQMPGVDFTGEGGGGGPVNANDNHGTAVAGCVSAVIDNGLGTVGIAPNSRVASARVYITQPDGNWEGDASDMVDGLAWAETIGAKVTNNSNIYFQTWSIIAQKYAQTRANGIIHFAAAGNQAKNQIGWPASLSSVNAVAAINRYGSLWYQEWGVGSNWGNGLAFSAPGQDIWTTDRSGGLGYNLSDYHLGTGTSYASPYAAGVAALVLSDEPSLSADEVERRMQDNCFDLGAEGYDTTFGWGLVNAYDSLFGTYYVDDNSPEDPGPQNPGVSDPNENGSPEHPFDAIQETINISHDGDTIIVRDGTYTGSGNKNINLGGRAITLQSENGADVTTIDCQGSDRGFYFDSGEGPDSVIDGFDICNGDTDNGGGIYCDEASPTIINCSIRDNSVSNRGGGIYCVSSSNLTIDNCIFSGNSASGSFGNRHGGGISCLISSPTISNCKFYNNTVDRNGGGICCESSSSPAIINVTFNGNSAQFGGGISCSTSSNAVITNCVFSGNSASIDGGGISNIRSSLNITNCTFSSNLAGDDGGGLHNYTDTTNATLNNCILWGNTAVHGPQISQRSQANLQIDYCDLQGGQSAIYNDGSCSITWGSNNIDAAPDFADANGPDDINGTDDDNLRLLPQSPCIDIGDNTSVPADTADLDGDGNTVEPVPFDIDGRARFTDGDCNDTNVVDMGAYEFGYVYMGDFDYECSVDFKDFAVLALAWLTQQGQTGYNPLCDISIPADQYIDLRDLDVFTDNWLAGK